MKHQFISKLVSEPMNIDKLRGRTILGSIVSTLLRNERPEKDVCGDPLPKMQIVGDVAIVPIRGVVSMNLPDWIKAWGFNLTDANDIEEEVEQAVSDSNVRMIVYDSDSPGGLSLAGDKLFDVTEWANKKKPVFGYCGDGCDMASTAYEAVASATALLSGPYAAGVGCIGSYLAYLDDTAYWESLGLKFKVFRSGDLKGIGEDALSEEQAAWLQSTVDRAGQNFRKRVMKYRTGIPEEEMQGQWYSGTDAAARGFVAGTAESLNAAIAKFRRMM